MNNLMMMKDLSKVLTIDLFEDGKLFYQVWSGGKIYFQILNTNGECFLAEYEEPENVIAKAKYNCLISIRNLGHSKQGTIESPEIIFCTINYKRFRGADTINGTASKEQVQYMIRKILAVKKAKMKFDENDALTVAICHAMKRNSFPVKKRGWKEFIEKNPDKVIL